MFLSEAAYRLYESFASEVYEPNVLDGKTKELIALACSVMADCVPCIEYHHARAQKYGVGRDEVLEALAISMSVSAGSKQAKYGDLVGQLEKH